MPFLRSRPLLNSLSVAKNVQSSEMPTHILLSAVTKTWLFHSQVHKYMQAPWKANTLLHLKLHFSDVCFTLLESRRRLFFALTKIVYINKFAPQVFSTG